MVSRKDTDSLYTPRMREIEREYTQWTKAHKEIKDAPPKAGRDYVKHAKNLLPILDAFSELHPIAKAVVTGFKAVVLYEEERKENDARVTIVLVAQADTMAVLLDINHLAEQRQDRWNDDDGVLQANSTLSDILHRIEKEIKACGNSVDTYYGENRVVKFWKAKEWKDRIMGHIAHFDQYRTALQQTLSVQVAADVIGLVKKMDVLLLRMFAPKADWEKDMIAKTQQLRQTKSGTDMVNDDASLQTLIEAAKDPSFDKGPGGEVDNAAKSGRKTALPKQLDQLKMDLNSSLDSLCERNKEMFELKLDFHAHQLQEAIINSAEYVVQSLSGPYDRLHNADLKVLWKEMNWIFCVDNKLFTSALFEYYLDHFSSQRKKSPDTQDSDQLKDHDQEHLEDDDPEALQQANLTKVSFLSRRGVLNHPDAWTLELMAMYGPRISLSIDRDESGFVRISEANSFTDQMPKGWSLPQWCAYAAIGWTYEARIYRKRIHNILARMFEMQPKALPVNRGFLSLETYGEIAILYQLLAWEPITEGTETIPDPPLELKQLVHEKMKQQDETRRNNLKSLHWTVDDETVLKLLYGKQPLEDYVLQLSVLLLENIYQVMQACTNVTIDVKEISHLLTPVEFLFTLCMSRIASLTDQFKKEKKDDGYLERFHGRIWHPLVNPPDRYSNLDIYNFTVDEWVLQQFPLLPLPDDELPYLKYGTWEAYVDTLPEDQVPELVPNTWHLDSEQHVAPDGEKDDKYGSRHDWTAFPLIYRRCNRCDKCPLTEFYYVCTECDGFDFCSDCYNLPEEQHKLSEHDFSHPVIRFALDAAVGHRDWMIADAIYQIEQEREALKQTWYSLLSHKHESQDDEENGNDDNSAEDSNPAVKFTCSHCKETYDFHNTVYKCFRHSCHDYMICNGCAQSSIEDEDPNGHQWWHSLIVLRHDVLFRSDIIFNNNSESDSEGVGRATTATDGSATIITAIGNRITTVEAKLDATHSMLQEALNTMSGNSSGSTAAPSDNAGASALENRMSQLESKVDMMVAEMRKVLGSLAPHSGQPTSQPAISTSRSMHSGQPMSQPAYLPPASEHPAYQSAYARYDTEDPIPEPEDNEPEANVSEPEDNVFESEDDPQGYTSEPEAPAWENGDEDEDEY